MRTITQRELRNDNAQIVREVEQGETFTVTRRGVPVARIGPVTVEVDLPLVKPSKQAWDPAAIRRISSPIPTSEVLDDLRSDR